jgi:XTP/dITP diphosphohydrolase
MDRLRSPGGCPWDAAQTHQSLAPYLVEETYETLEAIDTGDTALLREELGDLLLQVLFHARLAQELPPENRFGIEEVASDLVDKLIRRHPHVFSDAQVSGAEHVARSWEAGKAAEKGRASVMDGVPTAQPALALAAKLITRAGHAGLDVATPDREEIGGRLFDLAREAVAAGVDPEAALRQTSRAYRDAIRAVE